MSLLVVDDIRHWIWDRSAEDNLLDNKLSFTDDEIVRAMKMAGRGYNSIPPVGLKVELDQLDSDDLTFFHGTVYHLYLALKSRLLRNDVSYTAGGVTTDQDRKLIEYLNGEIPFHLEQFTQMATSRKRALNLAGFYGPVG